jgi:hypothetical protein
MLRIYHLEIFVRFITQHFFIFQDNVLIELKQTGLKPHSKHDQETLVREDDPILVVHPNFVPDA